MVFTELPITDLVIRQVHNLAARDKQKSIAGGCPLLEWYPGTPIPDEDSDDITVPASAANSLEDTAQQDTTLPTDNDENDVPQAATALDNIPALPPPIDLPHDDIFTHTDPGPPRAPVPSPALAPPPDDIVVVEDQRSDDDPIAADQARSTDIDDNPTPPTTLLSSQD